jgi:DNA invertase Pin-like site-specific DNA recombinase
LAERAGFEGIGIWKETMSGAKDSRPERREVMALAQDRRLDAILVTELTRWGRSTLDLVRTLQSLSQNPLLGQIRHPGSHPIIDNNRAGQYFSIV